MTRHDLLLTKVVEECCEIGQRATKALRFGIGEVQAGQPLDNLQRLIDEYGDLIAAMELIGVGAGFPTISRDTIEAKKDRIEKYLGLSAQRGRLDA